MTFTPIEPATLAFDADGTPCSPRYGDVYHPQSGARAQARHVSLGGNELPTRWQGRDRFVVLETGFGLGHNFLATWQAWRDDPQRCARLVFISIELHPLSRDDLVTAHRHTPLPELAGALQRAWPPLTPDLHRLAFDDDRVELLLAFGDVQAWLPQLVASVDAFYLDGFAPARNPHMWDSRVCKAIGRLAAPGSTLATWSAAHALREHLTTAGFEVRLGEGQGGKRDITLARYAPAFTPRRGPSRHRGEAPTDRHAVVVGAGLAGCAAAWALARQGWRTTLLDRRAAIASEASGNPAGLFHGIVNAQDGLHARFNRAAALMVHGAVKIAIDHGAAGSASGLLRLETTLDAPQMQHLLRTLGLPPSYVQALDLREASAKAGIDLAQPCWFYPSGGWVQPAQLARAFLERAGGHVDLRVGTPASRIERSANGWRALDANDRCIAEASTLVLANAGEAMRLLGEPAWPVESVRGQISIASAAAFEAPKLPIAGSGYLLPAIDGRLVFGATSQPGDDDAAVRDADHAINLVQLARLLGRAAGLRPADLSGRTAWRFSAADRLPVIGAVPDAAATGTRLDQPRLVPRLPGLYVFTALGSRGITWSALGAQVLAAWVTGAPSPIEARLLDAIDPARFVSRLARRATRE
jgi:tRNA 5-methylaminomethyl-2-thiouridine biosynthesis bifunctional protein